MGRRIRAAIVQNPHAPVAVEEVELTDLQPDEVLVRIAATGICHTDLVWAAGDLFNSFPVVLGHETAGTIEAVGESVTRVRPGDRVVLSLAHHCGHCFYCESGTPMLCPQREGARPRFFRDGEPLVQGFGTGGFAEATIVRDVSAIHIPEGIPLNVAAVVGCAVATGLGAAINIARVRPGSTVAVLGCGGIGACVVMGARIAGAERIVAIDPSPTRRALAERLGATDAIQPDVDALRALEPEGYDYAFEATGLTEPMETAIQITRRGGTITLIGVPPPGATFQVDALDFVVSQRRILGCLTGNLRPNVDFDSYFRLYRRGLLNLDALISATVPFDEIAGGFVRARDGEGIRTLVTMG